MSPIDRHDVTPAFFPALRGAASQGPRRSGLRPLRSAGKTFQEACSL